MLAVIQQLANMLRSQQWADRAFPGKPVSQWNFSDGDFTQQIKCFLWGLFMFIFILYLWVFCLHNIYTPHACLVPVEARIRCLSPWN